MLATRTTPPIIECVWPSMLRSRLARRLLTVAQVGEATETWASAAAMHFNVPHVGGTRRCATLLRIPLPGACGSPMSEYAPSASGARKGIACRLASIGSIGRKSDDRPGEFFVKIRGAIVSLIACSMFVLGGCSAGGDVETDSSSASPAAIEVEEDLVTVDVRIARSLLDQGGSLSDEEIVAGAKEKGIAAVVEGDTVVYTMTKPQRDEMLAQMRSSAQDAADELIADDTNSVTGVEFNDAMTSVKVSVDAARYGALESLLALGFYIQGALYQQFNGVAPDDIDVIVEFVDDATGAVLDTGSYREMGENLGQ